MHRPRHDKNPLHILLVEDVEDDALLLVDALQSGGLVFDWRRVDNESSMIEALKFPVDIVFSDFSMPNFSGTRALAIVRQHDPDLPFIFVSGTIGEDAAVEAMKAGAQDYVMKGNLIRLVPAMTRELRESRLRRERHQADESLRKLSLVVKQAVESVFITDPKGNIEYVNPAFETMTGYTADEVKGMTPAIFKSDLHSDRFYTELWETIRQGKVFNSTLVNRRKNGELFYEDKVITPLTDDNGEITHFVSTGRDITERVRAESERKQLADVLEATPDLVAILDPGGCLQYLNGAGRRLLGLADDADINGQCLKDIFPEPLSEQLLAEVFPVVHRDGVWTGETILQVDGGLELPVSQVVLAHHDDQGEVEYLSTIARDISERKRFEAELEHQATHDALTELPNRLYLSDRLSMALEFAHRMENSVAILFLDLNNFKRINDTLGHAAGDALLRHVARRLQSCLRPSDTVARHGGDEFTIVISDLGREEHVLVVLNKLHAAFERPVMINSTEVYVTFSTGIAMFPHDGNTVDTLLRNADTAMYQAKSVAGTSQYRFYAPDMNARGHELLVLEAELRHALEQDEFVLHYQPQVDLRSGRMVGVEALIRWQHPTRGLVSPLDFIPLLENTGLITIVGEWVIRQACCLHRSWREAGHENLRVSINVSAAQFNDDTLLEKISRAVMEEAMVPQALELEITENVVMQDPLSAVEVLRALHSLGIRTAIDDFGTGYSSLAYLKRFPLNVLKIDQTFVADMENDSGSAIVEASISLAQKLGLEIVAEGVETRQQLEFLQQRQCDYVQGYYFSKPLPESDLNQQLTNDWLNKQ